MESDEVFVEPEEEVDGSYIASAVPRNPEDSGHIGQDFFDQEQEWHATVIGQTPGGKNLQVMKHPERSGFILAFNPGGELPKALEGMWTTYDRAELHARLWLNEQHAKTADAKAKS